MISGILSETFNNKQMVISSRDELLKRQKERMSRFSAEMTNPNSNNNNNRGNAYSNIEDVRQSVQNPTTTAVPRSSDLGSPGLKQERDFIGDDYGNHDMDRYLDSDSDRNDQTHMNEKRFSCEHCGNSFSDPSNLQRHLRQNHAGARAHPCPECGKTFATSSGLKQHQHIHSSIKPFTCEVCRKSYTQFSNLCRHKRMHADCRVRIRCVSCGEYFPTSSALNKHRRFCDAKSLFPDRAKVLDYGVAPGSAKISPVHQVEGSPPQLLRNSLSHLSGTSLLDFTPGRNHAVVNNRIRNGVDANSRCLPYLFPCSYPTPALQLTNNESDSSTKAMVGFSRSPAHDISPREMPETSTASVQVQCNDPVADCIKMSLSGSNDYHSTLRVDSSRFKGVERKVKYSPKSKHSEVQMSPSLSPTSPPSRIDAPSSSAFSQRPELMKNANYHNQAYPLFREFASQPQVSPPTKPNSERNIFQGALADNFKRMLDEMVERQKFFNLASAFAKAPSLYRPSMFSAGDIPFTSFSYLPQCQGENEKPLDLSINRLPSELGFSRKTSFLGGEKSPPATPLQKLNSPTEVFEDGITDIRRIAWPAPLYSPYGILKGDPNLLRFYGGLHGSLPFGKAPETAVPYALPPRPGMVSSHHPALPPGRMFNMLNSQRRMYDLLQRDYAGFTRRNVSQQAMEHSPNPNPSEVSRSYGGYGFGRTNGRYDREKYVCKYCGKLFPRSANLTRHLRTHTGEQPYSCKYCDRNFSISSNLQRHVRNIHKKERPYCCPLCKRAFGQQTNLERHLRKHLEKPESVVRGNLPQNISQIGSSRAEISRQVCEGNGRNSLSPRHSNDGRSSDWNEENSSRNELHTSSDEDSFDTSLPTSTSFSPNNAVSPHRETTDSLHIVSSEE